MSKSKKSVSKKSGAAKSYLPRPSSYDPVATLQTINTMGNRGQVINWTCYVRHRSGRPSLRTTAWLEGLLLAAPGTGAGIDLWDIGAQHRKATLKMRIKAPSGAYLAPLQKTDGSGKPPASQPEPDVNGFYTIVGNGGVSQLNDYRIQSNEAGILLEVYYGAHPPPGGFLKKVATPPTPAKQVEDGGPPCIPPVNEN